MPSMFHDQTNENLTGLAQAAYLASDTLDPLGPLFPDRPAPNGLTYELETLGRDTITIAQYRGRDVESPIAGRQKAAAKTVREVPPLSIKKNLGEEDLLKMRNLANGSEATRRAVQTDAVKTAQGVAARVAIARAELLLTGKITFPYEAGIVTEVDFGRDASREVTVATNWTNPASPILDDLLDQTEAVTDLNLGIAPEVTYMTTNVWRLMLKNTQVREWVNRIPGITTVPSRAIPSDVDSFLAEYGIPPITLVDQTIQDLELGAIKTFPDTAVVLGPGPSSGFGATVYAEPLSARDLTIDARDRAGVVVTSWDDVDPEGTWTRATGHIIPGTGNADLTYRINI